MSRNNRPPRQTFGLSLERLEAREVPAAYWWNPEEGSDLLATTADNWQLSPTAGPYTPRATAAPTAGDYLYFDGGLTTADCTIPAATPGEVTTFAGISLEFGYAVSPPGSVVYPPDGGPPNYEPTTTYRAYDGEVTLAGAFDVNMLLVECGKIKQADPTTLQPGVPYALTAGTLTVSGALYWTGGTLNSNSVAGTIALSPNAYGFAEPSFTNPGINGQVTLGSTLSTDDNAHMTLMEGKYQVNCPLGFSVLSGGNLTLAAPVPKAIRPLGMIELTQGGATQNVTEDAEAGLVSVKRGGTATVRIATGGETGSGPMKVLFGGERPRLLNRGTTVIKEGVTVEFSPAANDTGEGVGLRQLSSEAKLRMEAGTSVVCNKKTSVFIRDGDFELVERKNSNGVPDANQGEVTIKAPDHVDGDFALVMEVAAVLDHPNATVPIELYIDGALRSNADIHMYADQSTGSRDTVLVEKQIVFNNADLYVNWFRPGDHYNSNLTYWSLITSRYNDPTGNTVAINNLPTFHPPEDSQVGTYSLTLNGNSKVIDLTGTQE